jgi:hypothetical protein
MLVAAGAAALKIADGTTLILDAEQGVLNFAPDANELDAAQRVLAVRRQRMAAERSAAQTDCRTADGRRIEVFANLGSRCGVDGSSVRPSRRPSGWRSSATRCPRCWSAGTTTAGQTWPSWAGCSPG